MPKFSENKKQDALRDDPDDAAPTQADADAQPPQDAPAPADAAPAPEGDDKDAEDAPAEPDHASYHEVGQPHIDLALFVASHPAKADQLAGFASHARREHPDRRYTREQWDQHLAQFNDRPVR